MKNYTQRVAAITGAGSGIGRALALDLAGRGCHLSLADINADRLQAVRTEIANTGVNCSIHMVDVAQREQVEQYAKATVATHGHVHMIFNNAGVGLADYVETQSYADFEWLMNINFWGVVYGSKAFLPYLHKVDEAHIINISSLFGLGAVPSQAAYNAAKFAVRGFTEALKMELADSAIRVSCIHPGGIRTNIVNDARMNEKSLMLSRNEFSANFDKLAKTDAAKAARIILHGVARNKRRILVGADARIIDKIIRLFPGSYEKILRLEKRVHERLRSKTGSPARR
ncbi:MAG: SDR family oxidoreductase [Gammaproteobacteria bacterium]|nr:SDR family oxidoreductase [Gammaproteobacteria bacterium]